MRGDTAGHLSGDFKIENTGVGVPSGHDVDAMVAAAARGYADRLRAEVKAPAEADRLRAELDADARARELATLHYAVHGVWEKQAMLTPTDQDRARLDAARLALEVKHPELLAAAARYRDQRQAERRQAAVDTIVASAMAYPHGRNGSGVADRLRRMAVNGSAFAGEVLAEVHARQAKRLNRAIVAAGGTGWEMSTVGGHVRAQRNVFHPDGTVTTQTRWRYRGEGDWLTPRQFGARVDQARQRARARARQIPAVGRPRRQ